MSLYHNIPAPTLGRQDPNKSTGALIFWIPFYPLQCDYLVPSRILEKKNMVDDKFPTQRKTITLVYLTYH